MEEAYLKGAIFESVNMNAVSLANRESADDFTIHVKSRSGPSEKDCCQVLTACAKDLCLEIGDESLDDDDNGGEDGTDIFDGDIELAEAALASTLRMLVFDRFSGDNESILGKVEQLSQELFKIANGLNENLGKGS